MVTNIFFKYKHSSLFCHRVSSLQGEKFLRATPDQVTVGGEVFQRGRCQLRLKPGTNVVQLFTVIIYVYL
jgi:hypothetical protein